MKTILHYILKLAIWWLGIFLVFRVVFLCVNAAELAGIGASEWLPSLFAGWRLDLSLVCYLLALPSLLGVLHEVLTPVGLRKAMRLVLNAFVFLSLLLVALLQATELSTYGEWHSKVNARILFYLDHLQEGFRAATLEHFLLFLGAFLAVMLLGYWVYWRGVRLRESVHAEPGKRRWLTALGLLPIFVLLGLGARGSIDDTPVNLGDAFYSRHYILNDVATNSTWNFISSVREYLREGDYNPYLSYSQPRAKAVVDGIYAAPMDSFPRILTTQRPNIVLIVQEGMSADLVCAYGGMPGFSSAFDDVASEGLLFPDMYSAGWTSDVGHLTIFSGFPALPQANLITQPDKYRKLPSVLRSLKEAGYAVVYYYGGQSGYGNIKGYLIDQGVDAVIDEDQLSSDVDEGRLGLHDGYMYGKLAADLPTKGGPWCRILFTLSTHTPFDIPVPTGCAYQGPREDLAHAAYYSDSTFGRFVRQLKSSGQWENTLLITIPDHGQTSTIPWRAVHPGRYRIGMMFAGGALKPEFRGQRIERIVSQMDFAGTLLPQLGLSAQAFPWSKNLLAPDCPEFAYYVYPSGFAWLRTNGMFVQTFGDPGFNEWNWPEPACKDSILVEGKAYLQHAQQCYLEL